MNRQLLNIIVASIIGAITGASVILIQYYDRGYSQRDVERAYKNGHDIALDITTPSERLEAVCAALWFKSNQEK